jgi:hypothetical protein
MKLVQSIKIPLMTVAPREFIDVKKHYRIEETGEIGAVSFHADDDIYECHPDHIRAHTIIGTSFLKVKNRVLTLSTLRQVDIAVTSIPSYLNLFNQRWVYSRCL